MSLPRMIYRAAWVCPGDQPPIENGAVEVALGQVEAVDRFDRLNIPTDHPDIQDLGDGAIIPGLVNAHTHLEFSSISKPLGEPGIRFTDWIHLIVQARRATDAIAKRDSIRTGIREAFETGTVLIGDIATDPLNLTDYDTFKCPEQRVEFCVFLEQLGRNRADLTSQLQRLVDFFNCEPPSNIEITMGASPHAPYSVQPALLSQICEMTNQMRPSQSVLAMHVAETRAERELLDSLTGDFVDLLKDFGVWDPASFEPRQSVLQILKALSQAERALVVHGNYLTDTEMDFIVGASNKMSVVFCPRTHRHFQHERYPLDRLLEREINVAVGTDSRASNPDLNLYAELQLIASDFPHIPKQEILKMGTHNGALALRRTRSWGEISSKKNAAMNFVPRPAGFEQAHVDEWLFESAAVPIVDSRQKN